jgi:hypothetical protein
LEHKAHGIGDAVLGKLLRECVAVRCGFEESVCEKWLGPNGTRPLVARYKPGRPHDPAWLGRLKTWSFI